MDTFRTNSSTPQTFIDAQTAVDLANNMTRAVVVQSAQPDDDSSTTSTILGGVVAAVAAIIILVVAIVTICCRSYDEDQPSAMEVTHTTADCERTRAEDEASFFEGKGRARNKVLLVDEKMERPPRGRGVHFYLHTPPVDETFTDQSPLSLASIDLNRLTKSFFHHGGAPIHHSSIIEHEKSLYSNVRDWLSSVTADSSGTSGSSCNNSGRSTYMDRTMRRSSMYVPTSDQSLSFASSGSRRSRRTYADGSSVSNSRSLPDFDQSLFLDHDESGSGGDKNSSYRFYDITTLKRLSFSESDISTTVFSDASGSGSDCSSDGGESHNMSAFRMWMLCNVDRMDVIDEDEHEGEQSTVVDLTPRRPAGRGAQFSNDTVTVTDKNSYKDHGNDGLEGGVDSSTFYSSDGVDSESENESEPLLFQSCSEGGVAIAGEREPASVVSCVPDTALSESAASNYQTCREQLTSSSPSPFHPHAHPASPAPNHLRAADNNGHAPPVGADPASLSSPPNRTLEARTQGEGQSFRHVRHTPSPDQRIPGPLFHPDSRRPAEPTARTRPRGSSCNSSGQDSSPGIFPAGQGYSPDQGEAEEHSQCSGTSAEVSSSCFELSYVVFHTLPEGGEVEGEDGEQGGCASGDAMQAVYDCFDPPSSRVNRAATTHSPAGGAVDLFPVAPLKAVRKSRSLSSSSCWSDSHTDYSP